MSEISKKVSYLKGLAEGMAVSEKSDEGRLIGKLLEVLSEAADEIDALWNKNDELEDRLEALDEDVYSICMDVDGLYEALDEEAGEDEDDYDYEDFDDDEDEDDLFDMYDDEEDGLFEIMCPECGEDVVVDFDMLDDENNIVCPNCHQEIELEFDVEDDETEEE